MFLTLRFDLRNPDFAGVPMAERYQAALDMCAWADERGGVYVGLSEHHGSDDGYLSSPLAFAAAVAARTSNVRIGINALIAPFHDPLRLAEDAATVDLVSNGRLDLTLAAGYVPGEFDMFGVSRRERVSRLEEAVTTLRAAWTGEPFEYRGRTVQVTPAPAQPGGPRIVLGGSTEAAARRAARLGDGFIPTDGSCWAFYRDECEKLGKPDPGPAPFVDAPTVVVLAEDPDEAWPLLGPYLLHDALAYNRFHEGSGLQCPFTPAADVDELRAIGQYRIVTPEEYGAELAASPVPVAGLHPMVGGIPPELAWEQLLLFEKHFLSGRA